MKLLAWDPDIKEIVIRWTWLPWWIAVSTNKLSGLLAKVYLARKDPTAQPEEEEMRALDELFKKSLLETFPEEEKILRNLVAAYSASEDV